MKLHPTIAELLREIDGFIEHEGITRTEFGLTATGDPNLYRRLRNGAIPRLTTIDRIRSFLEKQGEAA
jgi:hypothetical protein